MKYVLTLFLALFSLGLSAQRVGLVLSGGGAKGLYHIGVLKALEENEIPIDYVSGTSMGSIVAGLYAIGYTPDEMADLFESEQVRYWMSGKIESRYFYYFKRMTPTPAMVTLNLNLKAKKNIAVLPTNLIPSTQIDLSFNEIFDPASAESKGDFNNLFVPFRCIASDVYNKREVVFRHGDIGRAIRASMTIPLVFRPLKQDSILLYDGGIYNNFPWQVLEEDFDPDVLIGSKCVSGVKNPDENNLMEQVEAITMMHTDYNLPEDKGIMIERVFEDVGMLDFAQARYIIEKGYEDAMARMDSIKARIPRRVGSDELHNRRLVYRSGLPELVFDDYRIQGLNSQQVKYVRRMLGLKKGKDENEVFSFPEFKSEYFKILSEGEITGDYPRMTYDDTTGYFSVDLTLRTRPSFRIMLGGNISSTSLNQAYVGLEYKLLDKNAYSFRFGGNFSTLYTSILLGLRGDFFLRKPFYYDLYFVYNRYNYKNGSPQSLFRKYGYNKLNDNYLTASVGFPLGRSSVFQVKGNVGRNNYFYFTDPARQYEEGVKSERTKFDFYGVQAEVTKQTLNFTLYPTRGIHQTASVVYVHGKENFHPGNVYTGTAFPESSRRKWFGGRFMREEYFPVSRWFSFGYLVDCVISSHPDFYTEHATNFTAPAFTPTPFSQTVYLDKFRSNTFVGAGLMPTFEFTENFYLKNSGYLFLPEEYLRFRDKDRRKERMRYMLSSSLVYQTPIGPASLTLSRFDMNPKKWFLVFNFGYTLFNKKGLFY